MSLSEPRERSYFCLLPDDIIIKILCDVDTSTVLNFCKEFKCDYFLERRSIVQTLDLHNNYKLPLITDLAKIISCEFVTTLNVNSIYWVPVTTLRNFIKKLQNLETLYAIQTNLGLNQSDLEMLNSLPKLEKLGISASETGEIGKRVIPTIKILYVHADKVRPLIGPNRTLSTIFPSVEKIWLEIENDCYVTFLYALLSMENKIKIYCQCDSQTKINFSNSPLTVYYKNRRYLQTRLICCEKIEPRPISINVLLTSSWRILSQLRYWTPFSPSDARRLICQENTLDDLFFEELNFCHPFGTCRPICRVAIHQILNYGNVQRLKRLSVMMCLFRARRLQEPCRNLRKRTRSQTSMGPHPMEGTFRNFLGLTHLEVFYCNNITCEDVIQGYNLISIFENLKSLAVEVSLAVDGIFIIEVLRRCKNLQVLKIIAGRNERLNYSLYHAIPIATALKDFRYECIHMEVDTLLQRFCLMKSKTLERIVLVSYTIDKFSLPVLIHFLDANPQLVFLYFLFECCPEDMARSAQKTLNTYKRTQPFKVFFVKTPSVDLKPGYPIPDVHYYEMVNDKYCNATGRSLDHFQTF